MKKKIILSIAFIISLLPMFLNQYGGLKGVQEITGLINLLNPIGMVSVILFAVGVWFPFKEQVVGKSLGALGTIGIVVSEIYKFFTWHVMNITGEVSIHKSIRFAFPEFLYWFDNFYFNGGYIFCYRQESKCYICFKLTDRFQFVEFKNLI